MEEQISKELKKILGQASGAIMPNEFEQVVETIFSVMKELKTYLEVEMSKGDSETMKICESMMSQMSNMETRITEIMKSKASMSEMKQAINGVISDLDTVKQTIPTISDLSVLEARIDEIKASIPVIKDTILDNPIQIRNKLESIKEEKEKLSIEAISELRKELDELRKVVKQNYGGGLSVFGGRQLRISEFSFTGNGVLTDFVLPKTPSAKGLAIWAFYMGQHLQRGTQFTVSGKTLSCVGWVPDNGAIIDGFIII